jgi:hypothetical protein
MVPYFAGDTEKIINSPQTILLFPQIDTFVRFLSAQGYRGKSIGNGVTGGTEYGGR